MSIRATNVGSGQFKCPHCELRQPYVRKIYKRWITLRFGIPLFPYETLNEVVECGVCERAWSPQVLEHEPQYNAIHKALLVHFARMSGRRDAAFTEYVAGLHRAFDGHPATGEEIAAELARPAVDVDPAAYRLSFILPPSRFETVLTALAYAAGPLDDAKRAALDHIGKRIGLSEAHIDGILINVRQAA